MLRPLPHPFVSAEKLFKKKTVTVDMPWTPNKRGGNARLLSFSNDEATCSGNLSLDGDRLGSLFFEEDGDILHDDWHDEAVANDSATIGLRYTDFKQVREPLKARIPCSPPPTAVKSFRRRLDFDGSALVQRGGCESPARKTGPPKQAVSPPPQQEVEVSRYVKDFEELSRLGEGEYGVVFKCRNRTDGCLYAIKQLKRSKLNSQSSAMREIQALATLSALCDTMQVVNIVRCDPPRYNIFLRRFFRYYSVWTEADGDIYVQTELCDGGCLEVGPKYTEEQLYEIINQVGTVRYFLLFFFVLCVSEERSHNRELRSSTPIKWLTWTSSRAISSSSTTW